jgi:hypothetical protein
VNHCPCSEESKNDRQRRTLREDQVLKECLVLVELGELTDHGNRTPKNPDKQRETKSNLHSSSTVFSASVPQEPYSGSKAKVEDAYTDHMGLSLILNSVIPI